MIHGTLDRRVIPGLRQGNTKRTGNILLCQEVRKYFKGDGVMSKGQKYHLEGVQVVKAVKFGKI